MQKVPINEFIKNKGLRAHTRKKRTESEQPQLNKLAVFRIAVVVVSFLADESEQKAIEQRRNLAKKEEEETATATTKINILQKTKKRRKLFWKICYIAAQ